MIRIQGIDQYRIAVRTIQIAGELGIFHDSAKLFKTLDRHRFKKARG